MLVAVISIIAAIVDHHVSWLAIVSASANGCIADLDLKPLNFVVAAEFNGVAMVEGVYATVIDFVCNQFSNVASHVFLGFFGGGSIASAIPVCAQIIGCNCVGMANAINQQRVFIALAVLASELKCRRVMGVARVVDSDVVGQIKPVLIAKEFKSTVALPS